MVVGMVVLLLLCLPLVFASYAFQLEDKNRHIFSFFLGIFTAGLLIPVVSTVFPLALHNIDSMKSYVYHAFFTHTIVPLLITALAVFLLSGFQPLAVPSGLFGLFTVKIYQQLFITSADPRVMPVVFYILLYASTLFIFDALLHFCAEITFYYYTVCGLCFLGFLGLLFGAYFGWGLWYFGNISSVSAVALFAGLTVLALALHITVYRRAGSV